MALEVGTHAKDADVFAAHAFLLRQDSLGTEGRDEDLVNLGGECRIIILDRC